MFRDRTKAMLDHRGPGPGPGPVLTLLGSQTIGDITHDPNSKPMESSTTLTQPLNHTSSRKSSSALFGRVEDGAGKYPIIALRRTTELSFFRSDTKARRARDMNRGSFVDTAFSMCLICCLISTFE